MTHIIFELDHKLTKTQSSILYSEEHDLYLFCWNLQCKSTTLRLQLAGELNFIIPAA